MFTFTDVNSAGEGLKVPYIEEARSDYAPYYSPRGWSVQKAQAAVSAEFSKLGAGIQRFREVDFQIEGQERRGYFIEFVWRGVPGKMLVAGLPIRKQRTEVKLRDVKIQALLNVRDWIKSAVTAEVFSPGNSPFLPHLLLSNGKTFAQQMIETGMLPPPPGSNGEVKYIEGEIVG
jgi:hypothetical protein